MEQLTQTENRLKSFEDGDCFPTATTTKPLIQRVTHILLRDNEDFQRYFKPISVAFGPLHHDHSPDSKLQRGEKSKLQMAAKFIKYSGKEKEDFYTKIKENINSLRECYDSKEIKTWCDECLAWLFLMDGCAVLFFILHEATDNLDKLGAKDDLLAYVKMDLFLLENQLPYQLLQILMNLCTRVPPLCNPQDEKYKNKSAAEILKASITAFINKNAMSLFGQEQPIKNSKQQQQQQQEQQTAAAATTTTTEIRIDTQQDEPAHLLELLWRRMTKSEKDKESDGTISKLLKKLCPCSEKGSDGTTSKGISSNSNSGDKKRNWRPTFRSVKELNEKGIWLKVSNSSSIEGISSVEDISSIENISFQEYFFWATLKLPPITVDNFTWPKLMNLIAYEMCPDFKNSFKISSYVSFLDSLIDQREDVKLMRDANVLYNGLGSDKAVALLFNKISKNLVSDFWLQHSDLKHQIQAHCNNNFATSMAQLYHIYFRSPWSILVFFGALLGLGLTAMQTYEAY
ncbi:hypothetical protein SLEP1_g48417 [Rubroshorea leprosula]|uniref:Uncharacterized protein n=1 Tax=Rubroshorea leprosula TaxID=152421 RepID=A0AAV5LTQ9_9ROSI|nr:hypothetical protein SLEP1_g48417 [Rubroshorea leprosula]